MSISEKLFLEIREIQLLHFKIKTQRFKRIGNYLTFLCLVGIQLAFRITVEAA
jgi:hypothetical protein